MCGKNLEYLLETLTLWGSPPRVREKPVSGFVVVSNVGITPACAGKTHYPSVECCQAEDHPRVCGKNASLERFWTTTWGSPPRVREKLIDVVGAGLLVGITPACAGKTLSNDVVR